MSTSDLMELACFCDRCGVMLGKDICPALPGSRFKQLCRACADAALFAMHYGGEDEYRKEYGEEEKWYK